MSEIMVSIFCTAYNHEKYIAAALEGFVNQRTTFAYEALVHEDASTDGTAAIIREYERKYPEIIKPIYQTENQYSKGYYIIWNLFVEKSRGKYIAMCEGDDYWIDPEKLQKQVDYMEAHPECTLCFTNGKLEDNGKITQRVIPRTAANRKAYKPGDCDYNMGEMALLDYIPTATILFRKDSLANYPTFSPASFTGDLAMRLSFTALGYAHCIDQDTCVYRFQVPGSATAGWKNNVQKYLNFLPRVNSTYDDLNRFTQGKYDAEIQEMKLRNEMEKYFLLQDYPALRQKKFRHLHQEMGAYEYVKYLVRVYCPAFYKKLRGLKHKT